MSTKPSPIGDVETLLLEALIALNEVRSFPVPTLRCKSYDIAARIEAYFRSKDGGAS